MNQHNNSNRPSTVLLMGLPNVGKSVLFNHFTGMEVSCANYVGTTVEYSQGFFKALDKKTMLVDVPGTYTLEASNEAERIAIDMLNNKKAPIGSACPHISAPKAVICVLDSLNLESSVFLLFQVLQHKIPTIAVLNRIDLAEKKGFKIDAELLHKLLGIPVIPTIAITGKGTKRVLAEVEHILDKALLTPTVPPDPPPVKASFPLMSFPCASCPGSCQAVQNTVIDEASKAWDAIDKICSRVYIKSDSKTQHGTRKQYLDNLLISPFSGLFFAIIILLLSFGVIAGAGMSLRQFILLPIFRSYLAPSIKALIEAITSPGVVRNIFIGEYGFLIKGLEWPLALVFPYVITFYFMMSILEDSGYMPRLGILLDGLFNKIGISGSSIIPLLLGYGCAIPAIMATRTLSTKKERVITTFLICLTIPCISQSGAIITLLAEKSLFIVFFIFLLSFFAAITAGLIMNKLIKEPPPYSIIALPELLPPKPHVLAKKVWMRIKNYTSDGVVPMLYAVAIAAFLYETGIMEYIGIFLKPLVTGWLKLPQEAAVPLILGIMRRELTILPLLGMDLTTLQLCTGAVTGLFYVPCVATVVTVAKEFSPALSVFILLGTSAIAFFVGGLIAQLGGIFF